MHEMSRALGISVKGVVQGVGYRPFVHRLALEFGLTGWVRNEAGSVRILVQGQKDSLDRFVVVLGEAPLPLARVDSVAVWEEGLEEWADFRVLPSKAGAGGRLAVAPDVAMCPACLIEFQDPTDRRYRYPFITCTDCGPRFSVIHAMPYDRERTSMSVFSQCPECEAEYRDPKNRRYHSETNGCPQCGPRLWFESGGPYGDDPAGAFRGTPPAGDHGLAAAAELLRSGGILALRGLGGFHLAVDATDETAVGRLREGKGRAKKPLAVMVREVGDARKLGKVGLEEERLLTSPERPIVLLSKMSGSPLAPSVAPGLDRVGVMISYTPLHHLLIEETGTPLVMTSGNLSEEPIAAGNQEAMERLGGIADGFLFHDREIVAPLDDSVAQVVEGTVLFHRRARGYAPLPLGLPVPSPEPLLGVGPHLKNTFALAHGEDVYLSQHIGDLDSLETLGHFQESLRRFRTLFRIEPEVVVRDLHPGYLSTRLAEETAEALGSKEVMAVQHHHAHVAAVLAEHGEAGPVVGLAFDGTGYGEDGTVWGAEFLVSDLESYRRAGHLRYGPLPGGESAVRNPWRTVLGYLSLEPGYERDFRLAFSGVPEADRKVVARQVAAGINAPLASSMGRLFDAAAAVLGLRNQSGYEGQAAMELEAVAEKPDRRPGPPHEGLGTGQGFSRVMEGADSREVDAAKAEVMELLFPVGRDASGLLIMDPLPLLAALGRARQDGVSLAPLAAGFHRAVARASSDLAAGLCEEEGLTTVALCGGVFQNALLLGTMRRMLEKRGIRVLIPRLLSPNDGAISYGQVAVAAARLRTRKG